MRKNPFRSSVTFLLHFISFLLFPSLAYSASSFKPTIAVLRNCGTGSDATDADNRRWTNDLSASNSPFSFAAKAANTDLSLIPSEVPYQTARIFTSASSYNFTKLSPGGRHFIRLYFHPASYGGLDPKSASFSVMTGPYTLLSNFSPNIIATAIKQAFIIREFFVPVPSSGNLTLAFAPSPTTPHSFAFINGIEIVSSPELFSSGQSNSSFIVGRHTTFPIHDSHALQTVARLNVGGSYISPSVDSGLFRTWYDDSSYIFAAGLGVSYTADHNVTIRYSDSVPEYIAPIAVYATARSMGPNASVNLNYNLTWSITVDNGFYYLIRLHFCEIQSIYRAGERAFSVYINNITADSSVDVILYAHQIVPSPPYTGVVEYRDYVLQVPVNGGGQSDLWVALHPAMESKPYYADAILNGLEVFKINDSSGNLAGPNPDPPPPPPPVSRVKSYSGGRGSIVLKGVIGGIGAVLVLGACLCCVLYRWKQKRKRRTSKDGGKLSMPPSPDKNAKNGKLEGLSDAMNNARKREALATCIPQVRCRHFKLSKIAAGTNNFDDALLIGAGGFGKVYKGELDDGCIVAIKRGSKLSQQGVHEFRNEIEMLSELRHCHLVSLIGYCDDSSEMILISEYMARGTLSEHLYGRKMSPLHWRRRLEICVGAAKGLHYLHTGAKHTLIHRDVKTTNILLDENWVAKVSDFGISRMTSSWDCSHVSTQVKGTFAYFDPEYFRTKHLTEKSDVYSFGVVLLEVLCARRALDVSCPSAEMNLAEWASHHQRNGGVNEIIDPFLRGKIAPECLHKFVHIAKRCLADRGEHRPSMANVLMNLELALRLQLHAEEANVKVANTILDEDSDTVGASLSATARRPDDDC